MGTVASGKVAGIGSRVALGTLWISMPGLLFLISFLGGCGSSDQDSTWQRVQEFGVIRVGMDPNWVPFEFVDGSGQLSGFDVELARELGKRLGKKVHITNFGFDGLYDALTAGQADMVISAMVVDMGRSADFAFSTPYFDAGQVVIVGPDGDDIEAMKDLSRRVLAVELGSNADIVARRWARRLADLTLLHTDSTAGALAAVVDGQADAALTDRGTALIALKADVQQRKTQTSQDGQQIETNLRIIGEPVTDEQYAVLVRKESEGLLSAINAALGEMRRDGTLEEMERKWLGP
jgi:ABC-type amino acid transport substrate-binding protein